MWYQTGLCCEILKGWGYGVVREYGVMGQKYKIAYCCREKGSTRGPGLPAVADAQSTLGLRWADHLGVSVKGSTFGAEQSQKQKEVCLPS